MPFSFNIRCSAATIKQCHQDQKENQRARQMPQGTALHETLFLMGSHVSSPKRQRACNPARSQRGVARKGTSNPLCSGKCCTNCPTQRSDSVTESLCQAFHKCWRWTIANCRSPARRHRSVVLRRHSHLSMEGIGSSSSRPLSNPN